MTRKNEVEVEKPADFWRGNKMLPLNGDGCLILGKTQAPPVDAKLAKAVLDILDAGLSSGLGEPAEPGNMCVEAAVSAAMGMDTTDGPICVHPKLRDFKISINDDASFDGEEDRAMALRRIAIAQLGTQTLKTVKRTEGTGSNQIAYYDSVPTAKQSFKWARFETLLLKEVEAFIAKVNEAEKAKIEVTGKLEKSLYAATQKLLAQDESYSAERLKDAVWEYLGIEEADIITEFSYGDPTDFAQFLNDFSEAANNADLYDSEDAARDAVIEASVQVLVKMKAPGAKFLYLTEGKAARKSKAKKKSH